MWNSIERRPYLVDALVGLVGFLVFAGLDVTRTGWATLPVDALFGVAVAIRRLAPGAALGVAWVGAVVQLFLLPSFINGDVMVAVVIFATSLSSHAIVRRLGLASCVVGGLIASVKLVLITGVFLPHGQSEAQEAFSRVIYFVGVAGVVAAGLGVFWLLGTVTGVRRAFVTERLERLEGAQELLQVELRVAQETERIRISREMHDAIGHSLAVIIAQSDGARYAVAKNPAAATDALGVINRSARAALDDVSEMISVLAGSEEHRGSLGIADLDELLAGMESSGLEISVTETGERRELHRAGDLALYRVVQETLTNALKHGGSGTGVAIGIAWSEADVGISSVTLETDGPGLLDESTVPGVHRGGHGLAGMRERLRLVGGWVDSGPRDDGVHGFTVTATIPYPAGAAE